MNQVEVEVIDPTELAKRLNVPETWVCSFAFCWSLVEPSSRRTRKRAFCSRREGGRRHYVDPKQAVLYVESLFLENIMAVRIELPEDIEHHLETKWGNLPRHALEALAMEGYRARVLSRSQVRRMLGFETGAEVDEFMKRAGVPFDYTLDDFEHDGETSRYLRETRNKELQGR